MLKSSMSRDTIGNVKRAICQGIRIVAAQATFLSVPGAWDDKVNSWRAMTLVFYAEEGTDLPALTEGDWVMIQLDIEGDGAEWSGYIFANPGITPLGYVPLMITRPVPQVPAPAPKQYPMLNLNEFLVWNSNHIMNWARNHCSNDIRITVVQNDRELKGVAGGKFSPCNKNVL